MASDLAVRGGDLAVQELEWVGLPIEDQLLDHLATPEGCTYVWKENLDPQVVEDEGIRDALSFVLDWMKEHRSPPPVSVLSDETGYDEFNVPATPVEYVVKKLRDVYTRNEVRRVLRKAARLSGEPLEAISYTQRELGQIQVVGSSRGSALSSDDMLTTIDRYLHRLEGEDSGISFGYDEMDEHLGGLRLGELTIILGRPKSTKSWQMVVSADSAWEDGETPVIATMEMGTEDMFDRWVCMRAGISWSKFTRRMLSEDDLRKIRETHEEVQSFANKAHFIRPEAGNRNVPFLVNACQELGGTVLYIDQLSWFDAAKAEDKNWLKIGQLMEQMKDASQLFPIMCAAQYNREAQGSEGIADVAKAGLSDMIGQTADLILGLYSSSEMRNQGLAHYGVVESRSFEQAAWEIKVNLSENSNFKLLRKLATHE